MIQAIFPSGLNEIKLPAVYQWDYNRTLSIKGINPANSVLQVHFSNEFSKAALVRVAYQNGDKWEVNIPNVFLQEGYNINAYIYLNQYSAASNITSLSQGTYYVLQDGSYNEVQLPAQYVSGRTYYTESGKVQKRILIPLIPRKKPDDYPQNPYEEEELNKLINYTNKLGLQVNRYANELAGYRGKKWVKECTRAEYNALVEAGTIEDDVLYCFTDVTVGQTNIVSEVVFNGEVTVSNSSLTGNTPAEIPDTVLEAGYRYTAYTSIDHNGDLHGKILYTAVPYEAKNGTIYAQFTATYVSNSGVITAFAFRAEHKNGKTLVYPYTKTDYHGNIHSMTNSSGTYNICLRKNEFVG